MFKPHVYFWGKHEYSLWLCRWVSYCKNMNKFACDSSEIHTSHTHTIIVQVVGFSIETYILISPLISHTKNNSPTLSLLSLFFMSNSNKILYHFEFPVDCVYTKHVCVICVVYMKTTTTTTTIRLLRISSLLNQVEPYSKYAP